MVARYFPVERILQLVKVLGSSPSGVDYIFAQPEPLGSLTYLPLFLPFHQLISVPYSILSPFPHHHQRRGMYVGR